MRRAWLFAGGLGVIAVAAILFSSAAPAALGDYAEWTFHGVLLRDVLQGHANAGFVLKEYPVPNSLTTVGLGVLMLWLPWLVAAKIWLVCEVSLGMAATLSLARAAGSSAGLKLLLLAPAMLLGIPFWAGFSNFLLGTYVAMLLCALLLRGYESRCAYAGLLTLAFFSHMVPFGFALLVLMLYAQARRRWSVLWQTVPSLLLSAWYFAGRWLNGNADAHAGMESSAAWGTLRFAAFKANSFLKCWGLINPAVGEKDSILLRVVGPWAFGGLFALNLVVGIIALALLFRAVLAAVRSRRENRFFWIAVAVFFFAALMMPGAAAGISDPGGRMLQVAVWSGICVVPIARGAVGRTLAVCAMGLLAADLFLLQRVAMRPPAIGSTAGPLPAQVRVFGHIYFADHWPDYAAIEQGSRDVPIYPTALFLQQRKP